MRQPKGVSVAYFTWIGWIVAFAAGDREKELIKFHLNQSLVLQILSIMDVIPYIGPFWRFALFVIWIFSVISAANGEEKEIPVIGKIKLLK